MNEEFADEYWGILVFGMGVLLMGIGAVCKRLFGGKS